MLTGARIAQAGLRDWRKLAQGLHARYLVDDFAAAARFVAAIGAAGDPLGHHPRVVLGQGRVDLELVSDDAVYREDDGTEHVVEWVTQRDVDLARRITDIAAEHGLTPDPSAVVEIELGLEVRDASTLAPVWAALLTGNQADIGRGTPGEEIRDATARVPNLWFNEPEADGDTTQRVHIEVYVAPEVLEDRIAAAVAAGGSVIEKASSPGLTVIADQEGNRGVLVADLASAGKG